MSTRQFCPLRKRAMPCSWRRTHFRGGWVRGVRMNRRVVVIGAGIAGLTAAAQLAHRGYDVQVFEKQAIPGGRAAQAQWDGFRFDLGPTLLFMLDVYRTAFASWGGDFDLEVPTLRL